VPSTKANAASGTHFGSQTGTDVRLFYQLKRSLHPFENR
jgi:hypothetical protein